VSVFCLPQSIVLCPVVDPSLLLSDWGAMGWFSSVGQRVLVWGVSREGPDDVSGCERVRPARA